MNATLSSAAKMMRGSFHGDDRTYAGVSTDTRQLQRGELFFALSGPNFEGEDFVGQARDKGAAGAVVGALLDEPIAQIAVNDTKLALGRLGAAWRQQHSVTVIGITGSNGKTTLKEMTAACLSQSASTLATQGNLNNEIGMPLMLLRISKSHRFAVLEMGASRAGEIAYLTSLAMPDVVVINNAAAAHLEGFGSLEGVAAAKGEILQGSKRPGMAILNADDDFFELWLSLVDDVEVLTFGIENKADICADGIELAAGTTRFQLHLPDAEIEIELPLAGRHNVLNACAAAAIATALGVSADQIKAALESVHAVEGRLQPVNGRHDATVYDDSYNANPLSVVVAGEFIASLGGESWFVLGDMKELGDAADAMHHDVGSALKRAGVDRLFATGERCRHAVEGFGENASWFESADDLAAAVLAELTGSVSVLVKGSRSMRMERVVEALRAPDALRKGA